MKSGMLNIRISIAVVLAAMITSSFAQTEKLVSALKHFQSGNLDSARICVDMAANDAQTGKDAYTWYLRGFIYKDLYTKREKQNKRSPARIESLRSFKISMGLDINKENYADNIKSIKYIATVFRNDVIDHLNSFDSISLTKLSVNQQIAHENWVNYKGAMMIADPAINFSAGEIEINLGMGRLFQHAYQKDPKTNKTYVDSALKYYEKVLAADPANVGAVYGTAIAYYNQGANIVNNADYDVDLIALDAIQNSARDMFLKARPYMEKARELDPAREDVTKGLCGIYNALGEEGKFNALGCERYYIK